MVWFQNCYTLLAVDGYIIRAGSLVRSFLGRLGTLRRAQMGKASRGAYVAHLLAHIGRWADRYVEPFRFMRYGG